MIHDRPISFQFAIALVLSIVCLAGPQNGLVVVSLAEEQQMPNQPGLTPYTPTKIEWLALTVNSQLLLERNANDLYELFVVQTDHETLQLVIRYRHHATLRGYGPNNPAILKSKINTTRELIMTTAKRYGWEKWVMIREPVEIVES